MTIFEDKDNSLEYINMDMGYDGKKLINYLKNHLKNGSTILVLGMGLGKDLNTLSEHYIATGSDFSSLFIEVYRQDYPEADLLRLDPVELKTDRKFDCIYSNKNLQNLSKDELSQSLTRQQKLLNSNGFLFHSFWYGNKVENHHGLKVSYYNHETICEVIPSNLELIEFTRYSQIRKEDSFYVVLKKRDTP